MKSGRFWKGRGTQNKGLVLCEREVFMAFGARGQADIGPLRSGCNSNRNPTVLLV